MLRTQRHIIGRILKYALLTLILSVSGVFLAFAQITSAGTEIFNQANADYFDKVGNQYFTASSVVRLIVRAVPRLTVSPDEVEPSAVVAANQRVVRSFRLCNSGNVADNYVITRAEISTPAAILGLYFDVDADGRISQADLPININQTSSPNLDVTECINVLTDIQTNGISVGNQLVIDLSARSNSDQNVSDVGKIINIAGTSAILTSPIDPNAPPRKLVNQQQTYVGAIGERLNYSISFKNNGDVPASDVVVIDDLPPQLSYVPNSLRVDNRSVTDVPNDDEGSVVGQRIEVRYAQPIAPNQISTISFQAFATQNVPAGSGITNIAVLTASNAETVNSNPAIVIVSPFGVVYSGNSGASVAIPNARVAVFTDSQAQTLAAFPPTGFEPNSANQNPFNSNQQGRYSFALDGGGNQIPSIYFINVTAENYRARMLEVTTTPASNGLYNLQIRALDGMPIAVANGFELSTQNVSIEAVAALAFNIPMFSRSNLEISKSADRAQAEIGDNVNYRVEVHNAGAEEIGSLTVRDTLPFSFSYIPGTARLIRGRNETPIEPVIEGESMVFHVGTLGVGERISISYRVRIGVNARTGEQYNLAIANGTFPNGATITTEPAKAAIRVNGGMFSMRQIIVGRVFIDENKNNLFDKGEVGVENVRLYLANGASVITDSEGLYSFPAVSEGTQVIEIDPLTIPASHFLAGSNVKNERSWTRLLRTPIGGGGLLRQNFALVSTEKRISKVAPDEVKVKTSETNEIPASFDKTTEDETTKPEPETEKPSVPIAAGDVRIENLEDQQVIKNPAINLDVSVFLNWKVDVRLNGEQIGENNIGTTREDRKNQVTTFTFIGLSLKAGPNKLKISGVGPNGEQTGTKEITVFGRGNAKRIEIVSEKKELESSGRDRTKVTIRAYDEWNNPAQDSTVAVQTSAGSLVKQKLDFKTDDISRVAAFLDVSKEKKNEKSQQENVNLTDGIAEIELVSGNQIGEAELTAVLGNVESLEKIRMIPELRPTILVGLAEFSYGKSSPEAALQNSDKKMSGHLQFFYRGMVFGSRNLLTLAYDSRQPLNRIAGQDRLFQLSPLERTYSIFGDSSVRFQDSESNSRVYARLDRGRNYALFGDFEADLNSNRLLGYSRRLTGVKIHLENKNGDSVTVTGAKPDTSFARQVIPGGSLSFVQLDFPDILIGSDVLNLEVRDRRNPEIILDREPLTRGVDYNIDLASGTIIFLRPITAFDYQLNLIQVVATYEYRATGLSSGVYTARANKNFESLGLRFGFSMVDQRQKDSGPFRIAGADFALKLPKNGRLEGELGFSRGFFNNGYSNDPEATDQNGSAFFLALHQPLPQFMQSTLKAEFSSASEHFFNPFGATITPGSSRGFIGFETKPFDRSIVKLSLIGEKNKTSNVDNQRATAGVLWSQALNNKIRINFGYDFRSYSDNLSETKTNSNLLTIGAEWKPTDRLEIKVKREQNLGEADPSFPDQTTFSANYRVNDFASIFFTQRLASAEISPIADVGGTGFSSSRARRETAVGVESKLGKYSNLVGRYQLENGIDSTDSFAVIGLNNRLPLNKQLALDFGYERGFHISGEEKSFNNIHFGTSWTPSDSFRASARYELRDRNGLGQSFSIGAAGVLKKGWTTLARLQYGNVAFRERSNKIMDGQVSFAIRPHDTDRYGVLFSYNHRNSFLTGKTNEMPTRLRADTLSADGFYQLNPRIEIYGRTAMRISGDGNQSLQYASTLTYLMQGRLQYRLTNSIDFAAETRSLFQPSSSSVNQNYAFETGYWLIPDLRIGLGYNFKDFKELGGFGNNRGGFYFNATSKISNLFNLFGTSKDDLRAPAASEPDEDRVGVAKSDKQTP